MTSTIRPAAHPRTRIAIIGGGPAGLSAAYAFSLSPSKYEVTLFERHTSLGGSSSSTPINPAKYGAEWINDGLMAVGKEAFHTQEIIRRLGFHLTEVATRVSPAKAASSILGMTDGQTVLALPNASSLYDAWASLIHKPGNVKIRLGRDVVQVMREEFKGNGKPAPIEIRSRSSSGVRPDNTELLKEPGDIQEKSWFDEIVIAVDEVAALRLFQTNSWHWERNVLGGARREWDMEVVHYDAAYVAEHYSVGEQGRPVGGADTDVEKVGESASRPTHLVRTDQNDNDKVEISVDLTAFQPQVRLSSPASFSLLTNPYIRIVLLHHPRAPTTPPVPNNVLQPPHHCHYSHLDKRV